MSNCSTARAGGLERAVRCWQGRGGSTGLALDTKRSKKGGCRPLAMKECAEQQTSTSSVRLRLHPTQNQKHVLKEINNAPHQAVRAHFHANYSFCCSARVL